MIHDAEENPWTWTGGPEQFHWLDLIDLRKIWLFPPVPGVVDFMCYACGCFGRVESQSIDVEQILRAVHEHTVDMHSADER